MASAKSVFFKISFFLGGGDCRLATPTSLGARLTAKKTNPGLARTVLSLFCVVLTLREIYPLSAILFVFFSPLEL